MRVEQWGVRLSSNPTEPMRGDARAIATPVQERDGRTHDINRGSSVVLNQTMLKVL
jgi:hypothetical protein